MCKCSIPPRQMCKCDHVKRMGLKEDAAANSTVKPASAQMAFDHEPRDRKRPNATHHGHPGGSRPPRGGAGEVALIAEKIHSRATPHPTEIVDARATYQRRAQRPPCAKNNKQQFFKNRTRMAGFCFTGFTAPWSFAPLGHSSAMPATVRR